MIKYYIQCIGSHPVHKIVKIFIFCLTWFILSHVFLFNSHFPISDKILADSLTTEAQVTISASLGQPILKLWGYGPPGSRVEIEGDEVDDFTYTESNGYFEFENAFLPSPSDSLYPELCLTAIDPAGRATPPTCIPGIPAADYSYNIGPVILPPTLSLNKGTVTPGSQSGAEGTTIPNSQVKIILAEDSDSEQASGFNLVETAKAYYIPNYTVQSDAQGNFSFNMPDASPNNWHIFAITNYSQGALSPKSNTLKFEVISPISMAMKNIKTIVLSMITLPDLIAAEILFVLLIIGIILLPKNEKRKVHPNITNGVNVSSRDESTALRVYQNYLKSKALPN
jgi:hypothetical protein